MRIHRGSKLNRVYRFALCALLLSLPSLRAAAQGGPAELQHLEVALWPEFDRPAMLVILRFRLAEQTIPPTVVELPIPVEVGQPFAVAWQDEGGTLFDASFSAGSDGMVSISIPQGVGGQLEYYADLTVDGQQRSFRFEWPGTVELGRFAYEVQQPIDATAFSVSPPPDSQGPGPFGLTHANAELGPQALGSSVTIEVSYQKSTSRLSQPVQSQPLAPSEATAPDSANLLPYLLAGAGALLVAAGLVYYARGRPRSRPAPRTRARPERKDHTELEISAVYCHQCGTKSKVNDKYCRNCGSRLQSAA